MDEFERTSGETHAAFAAPHGVEKATFERWLYLLRGERAEPAAERKVRLLPVRVDQGYLAGRIVTVGRCLTDASLPPWVEHEGKRLELHPVDAAKNARTERRPRCPGVPTPANKTVPFDPAGALLDQATGRAPAHLDDEEIF